MKRPQMLAGAATLGLAALAAPTQACTVTMGGAAYPSIQAAVNVAPMIAQIDVDGSTGACGENVLIPNVTLRMILSGSNGAAIAGANTAPTVDVRVKGFMIQGFTVTGGSRGIQLQRNANAIIDAVTVQNTGGEGIEIDSMAFGVVTNSTIQNNPGPGIRVAELASARIGANLEEDGGAAAPNTIANNGGDGVLVMDKSTAQIIGNTIDGNKANGINVTASASVSTAGNMINSNTLAGLAASGRSYVNLGALGANVNPDTTTMPNGLYGVACVGGAAVSGNLNGTNALGGTAAQFGPGGNAFDPSCPNKATSLTVTSSGGSGIKANSCINTAFWVTPGYSYDFTATIVGPGLPNESVNYSYSVAGAATFNGYAAYEQDETITATINGNTTTNQQQQYTNLTGGGLLEFFGNAGTSGSSTFKSIFTPPYVGGLLTLAVGATNTVNENATTYVTTGSITTTQQTSYSIVSTFVDRESLTVPAGTYNTCKFRSYNATNANVVSTIWVIDGYGIQVQATNTSGGTLLDTMTTTALTVNGSKF